MWITRCLGALSQRRGRLSCSRKPSELRLGASGRASDKQTALAFAEAQPPPGSALPRVCPPAT